jgi:hypothetical protein
MDVAQKNEKNIRASSLQHLTMKKMKRRTSVAKGMRDVCNNNIVYKWMHVSRCINVQKKHNSNFNRRQ